MAERNAGHGIQEGTEEQHAAASKLVATKPADIARGLQPKWRKPLPGRSGTIFIPQTRPKCVWKTCYAPLIDGGSYPKRKPTDCRHSRGKEHEPERALMRVCSWCRLSVLTHNHANALPVLHSAEAGRASKAKPFGCSIQLRAQGHEPIAGHGHPLPAFTPGFSLVSERKTASASTRPI